MMKEIPADFPVKVLLRGVSAARRLTCGTCRRSWDDAIATSMTPAPSGRCPFEAFHATIDDWIERFKAANVTDLDSEVHEAKSEEATTINNGGLGSQIEYLLDNFGEEFLLDLLGEES